VLGAAACRAPEPSAEPRDAFSATDSAGVLVAVNSADADVEHWRVPDLPVFRIGRVEGAPDEMLYQLRGAVWLSNGNIALLNAGSSEIRLYSPTGTFIHGVGRHGRGPGEFQLPLMLVRTDGDSLVVYDYMLRRLSVFASDLSLVREVPAVLVQGATGFLPPQTLITAAPVFPDRQMEGLHDLRMAVVRVDLQSGAQDTIALVGGRREYQFTVGERVLMVPVPLTVHASVAVRGRSVYVADGVSAGFSVYDEAGRLSSRVAMELQPGPVSARDFEAELDRLIAEASARRVPATQLRDIVRSLPRPAALPVFDALNVGEDGSVWLRQYELAPNETRQWSVFDEAGRILAVVDVPARIRILDIGGDVLLARVEDELGVEFLQVHAIERGLRGVSHVRR
jgi:hypothetical protein